MNDYETLKLNTVKEENISFVNGFFRYINHSDRLATTGFSTKEGLIRNKMAFRFDPQTIYIMRGRYESEA